MAIKGATFDLQTVLAKYDGAMYNALSNNHDGYVSWTGSGNPITFTDTNVLTLKNGYILVHGRLIVVDGATDITLNPGSSISSGDGRLVLQIDTSRTNTQTVLNQVQILQEYKATSASWRALSTDDINALSTGVYEVQLCHFTVANGTSSGVQIDISTDTLIGNLQDDIETLADNLEQTASDVGDLQALGLSVPIPVNKGGSGLTSSPSMLTNLASTAAATIMQASPRPGVTGTLPIGNGGTGGTSKLTAQRNLMLSETNNTTLIEGTSAQIGDMGFSACFYSKAQYTGSHPEALPTNWGVLVSFCNTYNAEWHQLWLPQAEGDMYRRGGNSSSTPYAVPWTKIPDAVPDIVQFYFDKSSYSHFGYANLQITSRTNISGDTSFTSAGADYWNIQLNPGIYRMNLYCSFQSSSAVATDVGIGLGNNANRRPTPIEARVQTTGSITKLNASGILNVTSYNDLYSFLIYMGDTTARDIGGYWTIERLG